MAWDIGLGDAVFVPDFTFLVSGETPAYDNVRIGMKSRLDTLQAAVLHVKPKVFEEHELAAVNKAADYYTEGLEKTVKVDLSVTADLCRRVLTLPIHPYIAKEEQDEVIREIKNYIWTGEYVGM